MAHQMRDIDVLVSGVTCTGYECERCRMVYPQCMWAEFCCLTTDEKAQVVADYGEDTFDEISKKRVRFANAN